jgi:hypothetical protein
VLADLVTDHALLEGGFAGGAVLRGHRRTAEPRITRVGKNLSIIVVITFDRMAVFFRVQQISNMEKKNSRFWEN